MEYSLPSSSVHGDSPGKNTGMGSLSLLQGIFPTQESNWALLHCRQILYQLSYQGRTLEYILSSHYLPCEEPCQKLKETAHFNSRREFFLPSPRNKPSMRSQIVGHNLAPNEQQQKDKQDQWTQVLWWGQSIREGAWRSALPFDSDVTSYPVFMIPPESKRICLVFHCHSRSFFPF